MLCYHNRYDWPGIQHLRQVFFLGIQVAGPGDAVMQTQYTAIFGIRGLTYATVVICFFQSFVKK